MNLDAQSLYWILVAAGFFLIAVEIFIPGGFLGAIGVFAIIGAGVVGFNVFGAQGGLLSGLGLFIGGTIFLGLWIKYAPKSFFGKWFTLQEDGRDYKSFDDSQQVLVGKNGHAHSDLRPSGIALIEGKKVDVVSEAGFVEHGTPLKVIEVVGSRVVVRAIEAE
ncbi:MAG: NfeD family protein [Kiritimatiellia bacterium]|jgi:membrane-bound serine protease (ClpP class)